MQDKELITNILSEFYDVPACVFARDGKVLSVALGQNSNDAYMKALDMSPMDLFGTSVGFSTKIDKISLKHIKSCNQKIIEIEDDLKDHKKNVINNTLADNESDAEQARVLALALNKDTFKIVTHTSPEPEFIEDAVFAWKASKYLSGENLLIAKNFKTLALAQNIEDLESEVENALNFACDGAKNAVLHISSDILTEHIIHACAQGRIGLIIYSGGNADDKELIKRAEKLSVSILVTGIKI